MYPHYIQESLTAKGCSRGPWIEPTDAGVSPVHCFANPASGMPGMFDFAVKPASRRSLSSPDWFGRLDASGPSFCKAMKRTSDIPKKQFSGRYLQLRRKWS